MQIVQIANGSKILKPAAVLLGSIFYRMIL